MDPYIKIILNAIFIWILCLPDISISHSYAIDNFQAFSYQVSIRIDGEHICSGALISNSHVLTAASCVDFSYPNFKEISVVAGPSQSNFSETYHRNVLETISHSDYYIAPTNNDIAILQLGESFDLDNPSISSIEISNGKETNLCVESGWEISNADEKSLYYQMIELSPSSQRKSTDLSNLKTAMVGNEISEAYEKSLDYQKTDIPPSLQRKCIDEENIICGTALGSNGILKPGNPLVCEGQLLGILSLSYNEEQNNDRVYTSMPSKFEWINNVIVKKHENLKHGAIYTIYIVLFCLLYFTPKQPRTDNNGEENGRPTSISGQKDSDKEDCTSLQNSVPCSPLRKTSRKTAHFIICVHQPIIYNPITVYGTPMLYQSDEEREFDESAVEERNIIPHLLFLSLLISNFLLYLFVLFTRNDK